MKDTHNHKKTIEEEQQEMGLGDADEEVYSEAGREKLTEDDDEMTDSDEGFMKGYDEGAKMAKCVVCGEVLAESFVEREFNGQVYRFCSDEHAEKFVKGHSKRKAELDVGEDETSDEE